MCELTKEILGNLLDKFENCTWMEQSSRHSRIIEILGNICVMGAGSEVWNRVYMIVPVKKFG